MTCVASRGARSIHGPIFVILTYLIKSNIFPSQQRDFSKNTSQEIYMETTMRWYVLLWIGIRHLQKIIWFAACLRVNTLRPRQHGRHFADDTFKRIFLNENVVISIKISLKFVSKGPINNIPALVRIMAWRRPGDKPSSETMLASLLTHICVTRPQWVNTTESGWM